MVVWMNCPTFHARFCQAITAYFVIFLELSHMPQVRLSGKNRVLRCVVGCFCSCFFWRRDRVEGLESGMRDVASALSGLGAKMERLAELTLAMQQTGLATRASVEVRSVCVYKQCIANMKQDKRARSTSKLAPGERKSKPWHSRAQNNGAGVRWVLSAVAWLRKACGRLCSSKPYS